MSEETKTAEELAEDIAKQAEEEEAAKAKAAADEGSVDDEDEEDDDSEDKDEELIAGQFKTQEEMIAAFNDSQAKLARSQTELEQLQSKNAEEDLEVDHETRTKEFAAKVQKDPLKAIEDVIEARVGKSDAKQRQIDFTSRYKTISAQKDFKALEPTMAAIAQEYKQLITEAGIADDPRTLDILYYAAKGVVQSNVVQDAKSKGIKEGERSARRKQKAKVEGGSGSKGKSKTDFNGLSLKEMRAQIKDGNLG